MWMKSLARMSCRSIKLLETLISSIKTMPDPIPAIWQLTVCKPVMFTPDPLIYPQSNTSVIFWASAYVTSIPSQLPHYPNLNAGWLNNGKALHREIHVLSMCNRLTEGGGHTRYWLTKNVTITCSCPYLFAYLERSFLA